MESVQRGATVLPTDSRLAAEHQGETSDRLWRDSSPKPSAVYTKDRSCFDASLILLWRLHTTKVDKEADGEDEPQKKKHLTKKKEKITKHNNEETRT